jgi:tetratricopeptide (TPR) repeat protein
MTFPRTFSFFCIAFAGFTLQSAVSGQTAQVQRGDKAAAYYHYSLGHLYSELAGAYGNRGEYVNKAIENYRLAIKADPTASFLSEELSDLYIQAGRLRDAVLEAEESLRQNPKDLNARRVLGRIYTRMMGDTQQGRIDENMLKKAIDQYAKVAELDPGDEENWLMLGRLQKIAGNSVEAEKAYKKVLSADPQNEDAMTGLAMVYADVGNTKAATDLLRQVAEKNPSLRTLTTLAASYEQIREYGLAAETLRRTMQVAPGNLDLKKQYAQDLLLSDQFEEALKTFEQLAAEDPKDPTAYLRMSLIYRQQKNLAKAREAAQKAKQIDPNNLEIRFNDVEVLQSEGKMPEAIAAVNEILTSTAKRSYTPPERQNRMMLLERLAGLYQKSEQLNLAVDTLRQLPEVDPDFGARSEAQIIDLYARAKDYKKAAEEADAAIKKYPNDRMVRSVRASVLADAGRADEAVAEAKKLIDAGKPDRDSYLALAQIYEKTHNYIEMGKAIDGAAKLSDTKEDKENIAFMRGAMYEKMKKYDLAEAEFRKVLESNPNSAAALNYLGYMLADRGVRLQEALGYIKKALDNDPGNGAYLDSLGWVYYRLDRLQEAEDNIRQALAKAKDPTVYDHLGDILFKQGKVREAIAQWQASLKEYEGASVSESDPAEIAKVQKKLESAKVRLAREQTTNVQKPQ